MSEPHQIVKLSQTLTPANANWTRIRCTPKMIDVFVHFSKQFLHPDKKLNRATLYAKNIDRIWDLATESFNNANESNINMNLFAHDYAQPEKRDHYIHTTGRDTLSQKQNEKLYFAIYDLLLWKLFPIGSYTGNALKKIDVNMSERRLSLCLLQSLLTSTEVIRCCTVHTVAAKIMGCSVPHCLWWHQKLSKKHENRWKSILLKSTRLFEVKQKGLLNFRCNKKSQYESWHWNRRRQLVVSDSRLRRL